MPRFSRRVFLMMMSQAATATVAVNMLHEPGLWGQNASRDPLRREPHGGNSGEALSRMKSWLLDAKSVAPVKNHRLLTQIGKVHTWVRSSFQISPDARPPANAEERNKVSCQALVIAAGKSISLRLPETGIRLAAFAQVNHGAMPGSGAVLVVQANGREIFRSEALDAGQPPVPIQVDLEKAREFSLSVARPAGKLLAADILEVTLPKVTLTNGRVLPLGQTSEGPDLTVLSAAAAPFSFQYQGRDVRTEIDSWRRLVRVTDETGWTRYEISYTDPATQLEARCDVKVYKDFPAVNWVLRLTNRGSADTPLLENILPLDLNLVIPEGGDYILHHSNGSTMSPLDFLPMATPIGANDRIVLAPNGGRSSDSVLPFFNLQWRGGGVAGAIGWTGQWSMRLQNDRHRCGSLQAGQQTTRLKLHPGESIRTPSIALVPWRGDSAVSGSNLLRRLLLAHVVARIDDKIAVPPVSMWQLSFVGGNQTLNDVNEENQLAAIEQIAENHFGTEVFWLDAGWMAGGGWWGGVGNWTADKKKFPNGLKPVADAANKQGMQFLLWFEPERVIAKTQVAEEHPEWVMHNAAFGIQGLFALGNPDARRWMTQLLSNRIREWNIGILRHDFNITPLPFWNQADRPDRQGITEIRYIEGLYAMWDELRSRFPRLAIDCCASGGRRIDLESIQRCFYLWRSDVMCLDQPNATYCQAESSGLNRYVPTNGGATGNANVDVYDFRSSATAGVVLYIPQTPQQVQLIREAIAELKMLRPLYLGDYYPLTRTGIDNTQWEAWQFDRPETGMGFVMYFRRPKCPGTLVRLELKNLIQGALYKVAWKDSTFRFAGTRVMTGRELTHFPAVIKHPRGTGLLIYQRTHS